MCVSLYIVDIEFYFISLVAAKVRCGWWWFLVSVGFLLLMLHIIQFHFVKRNQPLGMLKVYVCVCVSACFCVRESFGRGLFSEIVAPIADESCKVSKSHRGWRGVRA